MANAIKKISLQRGYDVTNYTLCCFGGAGAQVACLIADILGVKRIFLHPYAGVLSAYGIGLANISTTKVESVEEALTSDLIQKLESRINEIVQRHFDKPSTTLRSGEEQNYLAITKLNLKYAGSDSTLSINWKRDRAALEQAFTQEHQTRYGFSQPEKSLVVESLAVEIIQQTDPLQEPTIKRNRDLDKSPQAIATVPMFALDTWHQARVYSREDLQPEDQIIGAAIVVEKISTIIIEPNWQARLTEHNHIILEKCGAKHNSL